MLIGKGGRHIDQYHGRRLHERFRQHVLQLLPRHEPEAHGCKQLGELPVGGFSMVTRPLQHSLEHDPLRLNAELIIAYQSEQPFARQA